MKLRSSHFDWTVDSMGSWLKILLPNPGRILEQIGDGEYTVEIKKYRKKRSLDQNALYWATLTDLAKKLDVSNAAMHNLLLRRYGQLERYGGKCVYVVLPDTDEAEPR